MGEFLKEHWSVVAGAPLTFILFAIVIGSTVFAFSRIVLSGALDAARERLESVSKRQRMKSPASKTIETNW